MLCCLTIFLQSCLQRCLQSCLQRCLHNYRAGAVEEYYRENKEDRAVAQVFLQYSPEVFLQEYQETSHLRSAYSSLLKAFYRSITHHYNSLSYQPKTQGL